MVHHFAVAALLSAALLLQTRAGTSPEKPPTDLPEKPATIELLRFPVDLDVPAKSRFVQVWRTFLELRGLSAFRAIYKDWSEWAATALPDLFGAEHKAASQRAWLAALEAGHPDAVAELQGLSTWLKRRAEADGVQEPLFELESLASLVSLYPLVLTANHSGTDIKPGPKQPSACTSTLVRRADGSLLHGRSLDYEPRDAMAESTTVLEFQRRGRFQYRCLSPLALVTATQWFTCVRPGAFSLSVNARGQGVHTEHNTPFPELLRRVSTPGARLLGEVAEQAMQAQTYDEALTVLATSAVVSSNYFILAGADGRGAIVTRFGNSSSADVWAVGEAGQQDEDGQPSWMRVQTNVDHGVTFASGAYATHRRQRAVDELRALGQESVNERSLMDIYLTNHARAGSESRVVPEDVGVILRPTTIATLVMDPVPKDEAESPLPLWNVWRSSPTILPPQGPSAPAVEFV